MSNEELKKEIDVLKQQIAELHSERRGGDVNIADRRYIYTDAHFQKRIILNGTLIMSGNGDPEGVVTAEVGALYLRKDGGAGTVLYLKESGTGNTGWAATT